MLLENAHDLRKNPNSYSANVPQMFQTAIVPFDIRAGDEFSKISKFICRLQKVTQI